MADSVREQILQALVTTLEGVTNIGTVSRGKIDPVSIQNFPAAFIVSGSDVPEQLLNDSLDRNWTVYLFLWTKSEQTISETMEAFTAAVRDAMAEDHTLGGLTHNLIEGSMSELFPMNEEQTEAAVTVEYTVKYRTPRTDPYNTAP